jgi:hypothetical protein
MDGGTRRSEATTQGGVLSSGNYIQRPPSALPGISPTPWGRVLESAVHTFTRIVITRDIVHPGPTTGTDELHRRQPADPGSGEGGSASRRRREGSDDSRVPAALDPLRLLRRHLPLMGRTRTSHRRALSARPLSTRYSVHPA